MGCRIGGEVGGQAMALTPDEIERRTFTIGDWGYERGEVHAFLSEVAATVRYTHHQSMHWIVADHERADASTVEVADQARAEARAVLAAAQRQAAELLDEARGRAEVVVADAHSDAEHIRRQAQARAHRTALVEADARRRIEELRQELLESLALLDGSDRRPIIDLTGDGPVLRMAPTDPDELADDEVPSRSSEEQRPGLDLVDDLVRSAVERAAEAARGLRLAAPAGDSVHS